MVEAGVRNLEVKRIVASLAAALLAAGCHVQPPPSGSQANAHPKATEPYLVVDPEAVPSSYGKDLVSTAGGAVIQTAPDRAPLRRADGTSLCIVPRYERHAVVVGFIAEQDYFLGAECEVSPEEYKSIRSHYGTKASAIEYLDQRGVYEEFKTWATTHGYVTTFRELLGRGRDGQVMYAHRVYAGMVERPHYSDYRHPGSPSKEPPQHIASLMEAAAQLNSTCRGDGGSDDTHSAACAERDRASERIEQAGWCWGPQHVPGYQMLWHRCR